MALPCFDKADLENMLRLFSAIIAFIVTKGYIRFRQPELTGNILLWIDAHITDPITIDDVAAAVYRSPSTVAHIIKKQFGMGFKQLCILKRIQRFESIAAAAPDLTVAEAALQSGYEDALYFSRQYKKVRKKTPSSYIRGVRRQKENSGPREY